MIPRITASLRRAARFRSAEIERSVHFHLRSNGQPFACDLARCESPGFTLGEIDRWPERGGGE